MTTTGIYHTLVTQLDKLARHNRQGSFRTKGHYEATKRFCAYLATYYHLQKLENVSGKHLVSYVFYAKLRKQNPPIARFLSRNFLRHGSRLCNAQSWSSVFDSGRTGKGKTGFSFRTTAR